VQTPQPAVPSESESLASLGKRVYDMFNRHVSRLPGGQIRLSIVYPIVTVEMMGRERTRRRAGQTRASC